MIEIQNLCAGYGETAVLQGLSLCLADGCLTAIVGPNGSGKSTLLKAVAGLLPGVRGQVRVDGTQGLSSQQLALRLAYLPQSRPVPAITARSLVLHGRFPHLGYPRRYTAEDRRIAEAALERFGVLPLADAFLDSLSGGERQKVYLAMAFAQDAQNLLLDEPTAGLDIRCQLELMQALGELAAQGCALAVVLHDLDLALQACHRVLLLSQGQILAYGTPEEVYRSGMLARAFGVQVERLSLPGGGSAYAFRLPSP